jgi:hypothetical protein
MLGQAGSDAASNQDPGAPAVIRVDAEPDHVLNSFDPDRALGTSIDVQPRGLIDKIFTPSTLKEMKSAGWGPITYRNNTELRISAWHWNENGAWSDPAHKSGYFVSSTDLKEPIRYIESYSLPHRGFSRSGGGASSLLDTGTKSYWKSNPYLTSRFTNESDKLHPQWVVLDLKKQNAVSAIRIDWENPFARTYEVDYWIGEDAMERAPEGAWKPFASGKFENAQGGAVTHKLSDTPVSTKFVRIWMTESSNTCDIHGSGDPRNCAGYAISDVLVGTFTGNNFTPITADTSDPKQRITIYTSSVDPWHSAADLSTRGGQHTGFDLFFTSGITNNIPAMIPVTMLYGNPEDSAAEIAYIEKRGYKIGWIEMGEEPDGKHLLPEDYGALYLQWATAIHKVDPGLKLGGPVFEGMNEDLKVWPDAQGKTSWLGRFVDYLKTHNRLPDLAFVSFEHYPLEPCDITWADLYREPRLMSHILDVWREDGVPKDVPLMVTESSISWRLTGPMSQLFGALWLADSIGSFFAAGGAEYYHSPIQPQPVQNTCLGPATWASFVPDENYKVKSYTSFYFAARLMNFEWVKHGAGTHQMFPSSVDVKDDAGNALVTSYAVKRPDGEWALMLVNRDQANPHRIHVAFEDSKVNGKGFFSGPVTMVSFGSEQYVWRDEGKNSHADPDGPPATLTISGARDTTYTLPKASVTVLRGEVEGLVTSGSH